MPIERTGAYFDAAAHARPDLLTPSDDEHVWTTMAAFRLTTEEARKAHQPDGNVLLGVDNLAYVNTGCFVCELPYSERETYRKCKGEPDG